MAALRATINPETGRIETGVVAAALPLSPEMTNALRHDTEGLEPVYHANGTIVLHLEGRFQNASVARIDENGTVIICSENIDQLRSALEGHSGNESVPSQTAEVR